MSPGLSVEGNPTPSGSCNNHEANPPILRLPPETLGAILKYVGYGDLLNLSLTCRSFHELASAQLYRHVGHVFSAFDTKVTRHSLDRFTAILETLATSNYNYAEFIRQISLDRANLTDMGRSELRGATTDHGYTSGRLLNTLLLIVMKRANGLESFKWDVHVELSSSSFETLSKMPSLQNLHVRFPTTLMPQLAPHNTSITPSLANIPPAPPGPPPPIDITGIVQATSQISHYHGLHHHHGNHQPMISHQHGTVKSSLTAKKLGFFKAPNMTRGFSLFSGLKSLAALDVDSLECVPELAQCISSSSSSVRSLKLSISDRLALKARGKNSADVSDSESTSDVDDWAPNHPNVAALPHGAFNDPAPAAGTSSAPASNTIDVCRARAAQEAILAQLFGLEEVASQRHFDQVLEDAVLSGDGKAQLGPKPLSKAEEDRNFVQVLRQMARILPAAVYSGSGSSRSLKALNLIERATIRYLEQADKSGNQSGKETASTSSGDAQTPEEMPKAAQASDPPGLIGLSNVPGPSDGLSGYIAAANAAISASSQIYQGPSDVPSVIWASQVDKADDNLSDIVDMEHPDDTEGAGEDQEFLDADEDEHVSNVPKPTVGHEATAGVGQSKGKEAVRELKNVTSGAVTGSKAHMGQSLEEYIRSTHGIPLDSLSLHLIPVKATVLCRAVDAFALKHLSLLNVGPQRILWAMLARLHQIRPLQLTSIHTDNVTPSFLSFVNGLDRVTELFLFECSNKTRVEPFAAKTTVKIEEIRQQVLTKHIKSMQRLVIRNDDDSNWALNAPAARLIAVHGSNLIELAVGLNTSSYHHLMQEISGLRSLIALQIFYHHSDKCLTMLRELRSCVVDHILHFSHLRIQYVSMCYSVHGPIHNYAVHIMTPFRIGLNPCAFTGGVSPTVMAAVAKGKTNIIPTAEQSPSTPSPMEQSPEDSDGEVRQVGRLNMVIKGVKIHDISGIKMWEKENWSVKL